MAKGFYLHNANGIWVLNNLFSKSEKSFYKIVFEIYFSNNPLAKESFINHFVRLFFCKQACR
jgi:hypothetical protein